MIELNLLSRNNSEITTGMHRIFNAIDERVHSMIIEKHIQIIDPTQTVVDLIKKEAALNSAQVKQAIVKGCLWIERGDKITRLRRMKPALEEGQKLHFYYNTDILHQQPLEAQLISDHLSYSIWHKPAGMLCQGSKWGDHTTIQRFVEKQFDSERPAIIVHRLDRMTEGLIIIAHKKKIASKFTQLFSDRKINKIYIATVHGKLATETRIETDIDGKSAISVVKNIRFDPSKNTTDVEIKIETGRTHQIRKHLSSIGFPVVGDRLYGLTPQNEAIHDLQLKAVQLEFNCPLSGEHRSFRL